VGGVIEYGDNVRHLIISEYVYFMVAGILWDEQKSREAVQSYLTNLEVE
jgi:hypothetical protein